MAESNNIQKVKRGQRVMADTVNSIINKVEGKTRGTGGLLIDSDGRNLNMRQTNQGQFDRSGQMFREPFDLSVGVVETKLAIDVVRSHLPNESGGFTDIPVGDPITFPQQEDVSIYLCELSAGGQKVMSSIDDGLSAAKTKTTLWTIKTNGVVLEDSRAAALEGGKIDLDLSSLNWVKNEDDEDTTTAQLWHYDELLSGDIADRSELTATSGWKFPVRPPDGTPHLKYVELSTLSSITGGGGGGGGCSCDLSVTPPAVLSSLGQDLVQIADWTKDNWQTHTPILAPDVAKDVVQLFQWMAMTPFWYNQPTHQIRNNYFYNGRTFTSLADFTVSNEGYYYLKIEDNIYGVSPSFTIIHSNTAPNAIQNTDTITYYPLWTINADLKAQFDWRLTWMLPRYSN